MKSVRKFLKDFVEPVAGGILSRIFWPPVAVTVVAHGENNDILALNQGETYSLPGGLLKSGETLKEAAERELYEETGFKAEIGNLLDIQGDSRTGSIDFFFEAEVTEGEKNGSWEGEPEFISNQEVNEKVWRPEHSHVEEYLFPD